MLRLLFSLAPALLAIGLGWHAGRADSDSDYVTALRVLFLGAIALAWASALIHVWRAKEGLVRRLLLSALTLLALRVLYVPVLDLAFVGATWVERLGAGAGIEDRGFLAHASLGLLASLIAGPLCMLLVESVTRPLRWFTTAALIVLALLAVAALLSPEDRGLLPQRLDNGEVRSIERDAGSDAGPMERRAQRLTGRLVALGEAVVRFAMPRDGWGGALREAWADESAEDPPQSFADAMDAVERAFVAARPALGE